MAMIRRPIDDLLEGGLSARGASAAGGGSGAGTAPAPIASGPQAAAPVGDGKFVNLQSYLDANKGGGHGMADKAFGQIESEADQVGGLKDPNDYNYYASREGSAIGQGILNTLGRGAPEPGTDRISFMADTDTQEKADALNKRRAAAGDKAKLGGSWGGIQTQMENTFGKESSYTQGEKNFDNALVGNEAGGRLKELSSKYGNLANKVFSPHVKYVPPPKPVVVAPPPKSEPAEVPDKSYSSKRPRSTNAAAAHKKRDQEDREMGMSRDGYGENEGNGTSAGSSDVSENDERLKTSKNVGKDLGVDPSLGIDQYLEERLQDLIDWLNG